MAHILIMPRQGNTVESCIITDWKIKEGDLVTALTVACEVETDKASFEIPAGAEGIVLKLLYNAGDDVPVMSPVAVIGNEGENWQDAVSQAQNKKENNAPVSKSEDVKQNGQTANNSAFNSHGDISPALDSHPAVSPRARSLAEKEALPLNAVQGTGPGGRIIERDVLAALESRPPLTLAAKAAEGLVPDQGTGFAGRITAQDVYFSSPAPASMINDYTETQIKGIRKIISERMHKSLAETAQLTLNAYTPVSRLQDIRSRLKDTEFLPDEIKLQKITVNDLILFAVSRVLTRFPFMNAHKTGDTIKTFERVHIGIAVDTPRGLMVPVIRNCSMLSLSQISCETKRLASSCQGGSIRPEELSGSTFTVSNLGASGITSFTPVLNAPEVAILGVCNIEMKPVAINSGNNCKCSCVFEPHIGFSLTINHQVLDGAPAARFLKALCEAVANIDLLLAAF